MKNRVTQMVCIGCCDKNKTVHHIVGDNSYCDYCFKKSNKSVTDPAYQHITDPWTWLYAHACLSGYTDFANKYVKLEWAVPCYLANKVLLKLLRSNGIPYMNASL